ncbi:hypothetical protein BDA96_02G189200 [Sorghum bicolor]|uniref:Uncharacterized protein n=1 Tax=Sorghum bicolor TaxID=4558 RepID=A0A921UVW2_SORBI|nr:hypothetical protein BDA96_02G189200 [Sorghum bicolor]
MEQLYAPFNHKGKHFFNFSIKSFHKCKHSITKN